MYLKNFYPKIKNKYSKIKFSGIAFNSNDVRKDYIFFAIKGINSDGNKYIAEAIKKGAKIIISENVNDKLANGILYLRVKSIRRVLAEFSNKLFKQKPKNLIAVTGTNGKSSVTDFYRQILNLNKKKVVSIGTLGIKGKNFNRKLSNTTSDPILLNKLLNQIKEKNIDNVVLEASSHGLKQKRLYGLKFKTGIFTNLSRDHFDYHKNYKDYLNSKLILFKQLMKKGSNLIYDDRIKIAKIIRNTGKSKSLKSFSIGSNKSELHISDHKYLKNEQVLTILFRKKKYKLMTSLIGKIQLNNLLMAMLAASRIGIKFSNIVKSVNYIKPISGRLEKVGHLKNNSFVILDYAHTPEALRSCLESLQDQFKLRKINLVFGCGGERDKQKRPIMGRIANKYCSKVYLTDDNPRTEDPKKIRDSIKKTILKSKLFEISSREIAIKTAINNINSDEILVVAGKGHEEYQEYFTKKKFSDKNCILKSIIIKNSKLSNDWKNNILSEVLKKNVENKIKIKNSYINSNDINKNDVFFGLKGKKLNGNNFADVSLKNKASIAIVSKIYGKKNNRKIRVNNVLSTLTNYSRAIRTSSLSKIVAITGSCGKTTLKELLVYALEKLSKVSYSKKSFNNYIGVPLSLSSLNKNTDFGIYEIGMSKKNEINKLSKLAKPDVAVITNITYAHAENFKNINEIAKAKSEIIENVSKNGYVILGSDGNFFNYFKKKCLKNNLNVVSFGKKKNSDIRIIKITKIGSNSLIFVKIQNQIITIKLKKEIDVHIDNILASLAVLSIFFDPKHLHENLFNHFKIPSGRGNLIKLKIENKIINLIDESYNSNPLSLSFALNKFDKLELKNNRKILLLGDMLELGKFSKKQHMLVAKIINSKNFTKIHAYGHQIIETFNKIRTQKRGMFIKSKKKLIDFFKNELITGDYLMIKGSNSTGLHKIVSQIKKGKMNAL
tara:strand:+ start:1117 stop:3960 length:2844 start_codon:yes stop_codon:yes gene_type:complete